MEAAAELLESVALESSLARREIFKESLASFLDYVEHNLRASAETDENNEPEKVKAAIARTAMLTAGEDEVMDVVFAADGRGTWLVDRLKTWLGRSSSRADLGITASIMLANLARKGASYVCTHQSGLFYSVCAPVADEHCIVLVERDGLAEPLVRLLEEAESPEAKAKARAGERSQLLHGVASLIKHLSIPGLSS
jgi:hypothetical protein